MATRQDDAPPELRRGDNTPALHQIVQQEVRNYILKQGLRSGDPLMPDSERALATPPPAVEVGDAAVVTVRWATGETDLVALP